MLLLCLNISHFTILHFVLHCKSIFSKAETLDHNVMIKNIEKRNERFVTHCSFKHSNSQ